MNDFGNFVHQVEDLIKAKEHGFGDNGKDFISILMRSQQLMDTWIHTDGGIDQGLYDRIA